MKKEIAKIRAITDLSEAYGFLSVQDDEKMLVIFGEPGTGKSTACQYLAEKRNDIYVTAQPCMTVFRLIKTILNSVGLTCRSTGDGLQKVILFFKESGKALFVDEIDWFLHSPILLEVLRSIHDNANVPVILIGMTGVYNKFAKHRQLCDRIHFLEFEACSLEDAKLLAYARCEVAIQSDLLERIWVEAKGNLRLIKRMMAYIESDCEIAGIHTCNSKQWDKKNLLPKFSKKPTKRVRGAA